MPTPTTAEERLYACAFTKATTWGTEVAHSAPSELLTLKDGDLATARKQNMVQLKESNNTFLRSIVAGAVTGADIPVELYVRYEAGAFGTLWALLFGTAGAPAVATDLHKHTFQWATSIAGKFGSFAAEYPGKIFSAPSAKPYKVVLSLQDGILKAVATLRANTVIDNSAVNGATQMDALTGADQGAVVRFAELTKVYLAAFSHPDAMGPTEAVEISGFEISYGRGLENPDPANGATYLAEPGESEFPDIRVKLNFPRNDAFNAAFFEDFQDGTAWQLLMEFTGPHGGATTQDMVLTLLFPKMLVAAVPDTKKAGMVKTSVEFIAVNAATAPTGMLHTVPYLELTNDRSTDYLA